MGKKSKKKRKKFQKKKILNIGNKSEVAPEIPAEKQPNDKILLQTMTDDIFMLARIHYDLFDIENIQLIFSKLRCMDYDDIQER